MRALTVLGLKFQMQRTKSDRLPKLFVENFHLMLGRIGYYRPESLSGLLSLPINGIFAPYIGCKGGLYVLFDHVRSSYPGQYPSLGDTLKLSHKELLALPGIGAGKVRAIETVYTLLGVERPVMQKTSVPEGATVQ